MALKDRSRVTILAKGLLWILLCCLVSSENFDEDCFSCCDSLFTTTLSSLRTVVMSKDRGADVQILQDYCKVGCATQSQEGCEGPEFAPDQSLWCKYGYELQSLKVVTVSNGVMYKCVAGTIEGVNTENQPTDAPTAGMRDPMQGILAFSVGAGGVFLVAALIGGFFLAKRKRRTVISRPQTVMKNKNEDVNTDSELEDSEVEDIDNDASHKPWTTAQTRMKWLQQSRSSNADLSLDPETELDVPETSNRKPSRPSLDYLNEIIRSDRLQKHKSMFRPSDEYLGQFIDSKNGVLIGHHHDL